MTRIWFSAALAVVGCNALLDNQEGTLIEGTGGATSARGGTSSSGGNDAAGAPANEAGTGGTSDAGAPSTPPATGGSGAEPSGTGGASGSEPSGGSSSGTEGGSAGASGGSAGAAGSPSEAGAAGGPACECTPGIVEMVEVKCGPCGLGRQLAPRACNSDCTWSDPAPATGTCDTAGVCDPAAAAETRVAPCPNGGWKNQRRVCTSECKPGEWTDTEACQQGPNGCSGCACVAYCDHPERHVTTCLWIACSETEAWTECEEDITVSCQRRPPVELIDWRP